MTLRVTSEIGKLGGHLENASRQYEETSRAFERFTARLETIAEKAQAEEDPAPAPALPLLPPS